MKATTRLCFYLCFLLLLSCNAPWIVASDATEDKAAAAAAEDNAANDDTTPPLRVLTQDELKVANGVDSDNLFLCIFGRVYDVSAGKEYYGPDGPYHVFVGRDAPVPFISGVFTEEESAKSWDTLEKKQHGGLLSWIEFYEKEDKYPQVGVVQGEFYDQDGNATPELARVNEAMEEARVEQQRKEAERQRRIAERKRAQAEAKMGPAVKKTLKSEL